MSRPLPIGADSSKTHRLGTRPPFEYVALVLQGGGSRGAYQAGVYEALAEADLDPDWVADISIGDVNAALIAGNAPEDRVAKLRSFWEGMTSGPWWSCDHRAAELLRGDVVRQAHSQLSAGLAFDTLTGVVEGLACQPPKPLRDVLAGAPKSSSA